MPQGAHFLRLQIKLRGQSKFDSRGLASRGPSPRRHAPDRCAVKSCLCEYMAENLRNSACMPAYQASRPGPNGNWDARRLRLSIGRQGRDGREQLGRKKSRRVRERLAASRRLLLGRSTRRHDARLGCSPHPWPTLCHTQTDAAPPGHPRARPAYRLPATPARRAAVAGGAGGAQRRAEARGAQSAGAVSDRLRADAGRVRAAMGAAERLHRARGGRGAVPGRDGRGATAEVAPEAVPGALEGL
mmetsp:Transcript_100172/g.283557  ORF Transcript_100172/g.283557 Transcript_100172/m.283557 type:complete len:244 (-) Transcript_100172:286-1017(-)